MHDIRFIRDNPEAFDRALARRGLPGEATRLIKIDERRRAIIVKLEQAQARRNAASKEIGEAKKKKDNTTADKLMAEMAGLKDSIPAMEAEERAVSKELNDALAWIPNMPLDEVPEGADEKANVEHHHFGAKRNYKFTPRQHFDLGEALGMMDFELAAKLSGARFVVLQKGLARLERALAQFMLALHTTEHGYIEVNPPILVRDDVMFGTAQLPKFSEDQFRVGQKPYATATLSETDNKLLDSLRRLPDPMPKHELTMILRAYLAQIPAYVFPQSKVLPLFVDSIELLDRFPKAQILEKVRAALEASIAFDITDLGLWLIPTAEVPLTNLVRESIVEEDALPLRFTACTPCFRAEAGAAGKDTRGMIRQHQFTKVELVSITTPETSKDEHERMLSCAEEVLRRLDLHYRVVTLCTGDMGFAAQKTYDIEVWLPGQGAYREISSCSVCGDFQAQRMKARYKGKDGKVKGHVHTLNGSGVAVGRALIAVMENYQQEDGSIAVPDALAPYMGGMKKIEKKA